MPIKSLFNTSGSYEVRTAKNNNSVELTIVLDKTWAKQLGLPTNKFYTREPDTGLELHEDWLEQKLWAEIAEAARPIKVTDYYYPTDVYSTQSIPENTNK